MSTPMQLLLITHLASSHCIPHHICKSRTKPGLHKVLSPSNSSLRSRRWSLVSTGSPKCTHMHTYTHTHTHTHTYTQRAVSNCRQFYNKVIHCHPKWSDIAIQISRQKLVCSNIMLFNDFNNVMAFPSKVYEINSYYILWPNLCDIGGMWSLNRDQLGQWRSISMTSHWPVIMTSQWVMTLLGICIIKSRWVMTLLGTSIVTSQWVMMLLCVHIMASQCIMTFSIM